ncbi:MAG TPA: hypothetical protein VGA73_09115 [Candidatus Binatia bacterium]
MKKLLAFAALAAFLAVSSGAVWARCAPLIREGRELLGTSSASKADQDKAKGLLDEAQKNLDAGDHTNGVKNATAALDILKKK